MLTIIDIVTISEIAMQMSRSMAWSVAKHVDLEALNLLIVPEACHAFDNPRRWSSPFVVEVESRTRFADLAVVSVTITGLPSWRAGRWYELQHLCYFGLVQKARHPLHQHRECQ